MNFPATRAGRWSLFILGWAALSLLFAPEAYISFYLRHNPMSWQETVQLTVINSAIALLFIPGIIALTRRFPLERRHWRRSLAVHVPGCVLFSALHSVLYALACRAWEDAGSPLFYRFHPNLLTYWAFVGATQAFDYFRKYQDREREVTRLTLEMLKAQLQPHFLFNALHTLSAMMHADVARADRMLSHLSSLLRMTLGNIGRQEVRLAEEIAYIEAYLAIERERFGEALELRLDIDPGVLDARVPAQILQPLVENSVHHGFTAAKQSGVIHITAAQAGDSLRISVDDDGRGLAAGRPDGLGITNTRARLSHLYGDAHEFSVVAREPRGTRATLKIPLSAARGGDIDAEAADHGHPGIDRGRRAVGPDPGRFPAGL